MLPLNRQNLTKSSKLLVIFIWIELFENRIGLIYWRKRSALHVGWLAKDFELVTDDVFRLSKIYFKIQWNFFLVHKTFRNRPNFEKVPSDGICSWLNRANCLSVNNFWSMKSCTRHWVLARSRFTYKIGFINLISVDFSPTGA